VAEFPDHPFWDFSLDVYMSDGVGAACLELQGAHELDVNILLFCMWLGASGRGALTAADMETVTAAVQAWHHDVVRPLRAVRTRMKGGIGSAPPDLAESMRQRIQKTEIDCEHTEQLMLAAAIDPAVDDARAAEMRLADAVSSLAGYFRSFGGDVSAQDRGNLAVMLGVAFREQSAESIATACNSM
tara:strand:+ start:2413 stop:2970 length:558 start_codon:yes stop_codon:yes gene_type:complete